MRMIILLAMLAVISCNNSEENVDAATDQRSTSDTIKLKPGNNTGNADISGCYWKILQRDTLTLQVDQTKNLLTGKLVFDNYQKDGSTGVVKGRIDGNIIMLWYNFASEGMNSVMEIYFKMEGDKLLRGIGPVDVKGDTSYYTDHQAIQYLKEEAYIKVACDELPVKYK